MSSPRTSPIEARPARQRRLLLRVLVLLLCLCALVWLAIPRLDGGPRFPGNVQSRVRIRYLDDALYAYAKRHAGEYPPTLEAIIAQGYITRAGNTEPSSLAVVDAWGRPFLYEPPTAEHPHPRLSSLGADGRPGGEREDADIDSDRMQLEH